MHYSVVVLICLFHAKVSGASGCPDGAWTIFFNRDNPTGVCDCETLTHLRQEYPEQICENPTAIDARRTSNNQPYNETGQVIYHADVVRGFRCQNYRQSCYDYKVRFCCSTGSTTTTFASTKSTKTYGHTRRNQEQQCNCQKNEYCCTLRYSYHGNKLCYEHEPSSNLYSCSQMSDKLNDGWLSAPSIVGIVVGVLAALCVLCKLATSKRAAQVSVTNDVTQEEAVQNTSPGVAVREIASTNNSAMTQTRVFTMDVAHARQDVRMEPPKYEEIQPPRYEDIQPPSYATAIKKTYGIPPSHPGQP